MIRHHYYGNKVKLNMIINTKTGFCPENCGYCAQSIESTAPIQKYRMLDKETINLNTSKNHHPNITTSHTYDDRVSTVGKVKDAGISPCSGVIVGMKEE